MKNIPYFLPVVQILSCALSSVHFVTSIFSALEQKLPDGCQTLRRKSCGALQTKKTKQPTCAMRSVSEGSAHSSFAATSPTLDVRFEWSV